MIRVISAGLLLPALPVTVKGEVMEEKNNPLFKISLAQWSLHRALYSGKLDNLDFSLVAARDYDIHAVEYVNSFFKDKAKDDKYIEEMKKRAADNGVKSLLIMCDGEGALGDPEETKRKQAVNNHHKWVGASKKLGCHSIRVNARSKGTYREQQKLAADGLRQLTEYAAGYDLNVIVENHGGLSSNGKWLTGVIKLVDHPRCGTLPDFGNFHIEGDTWYDRYKGVEEMMPFAKAVSAKSHDFDEQGNEIHTDYFRMLRIVLAAGYHGHLGIEYEGDKISEDAGIRATRALLQRVEKTLRKTAEKEESD